MPEKQPDQNAPSNTESVEADEMVLLVCYLLSAIDDSDFGLYEALVDRMQQQGYAVDETSKVQHRVEQTKGRLGGRSTSLSMFPRGSDQDKKQRPRSSSTHALKQGSR